MKFKFSAYITDPTNIEEELKEITNNISNFGYDGFWITNLEMVGYADWDFIPRRPNTYAVAWTAEAPDEETVTEFLEKLKGYVDGWLWQIEREELNDTTIEEGGKNDA